MSEPEIPRDEDDVEGHATKRIQMQDESSDDLAAQVDEDDVEGHATKRIQ
jgi:hypothetical protein